ncbi:MAG TPA: C1 family peptidase [Sedimentisphaerales bacterium]|nr:C1 family peptidase [Sedimentisphaerales bacterium]
MKHGTTAWAGVFLVGAVLATGAWSQEGSLTLETIEKIRSEFRMDAHARTARNALTTVGLKEISANREILAGHENKFSHKIKTSGISNQKSSGRCWMFAGFNMIKPVLMNRMDLDSFEFSQIYLQFWDKMEKANKFLECMIDFRDRDIQDREVVFLLQDPCPDGGYFENFADLVGKYGVVPKEVMSETASSESTGMMNRMLGRLLRKHAAELREIHKETGSLKQMRLAKQRMMAEVYRILVLHLGEPPMEFTWRYKIKDKQDETKAQDAAKKDDESDDANDADKKSETRKDDYEVRQKWSEPRTFTPKSFYNEFVGLDLRQYVNIGDDPMRPKGKHYEIDFTSNFYDGRNVSYANVDIQTLKDLVVRVLLDNKAVCFDADVSPDQDSGKGIMARNLYDYESVYGLELDLTKAERLSFRDGSINHGMAFIGVDLRDGKPVKWLVENSWGADRGSGGLWTMYDDWFDDNVYKIIVHRDYVPQEILDILDQPTEKLPVWDPMW